MWIGNDSAGIVRVLDAAYRRGHATVTMDEARAAADATRMLAIGHECSRRRGRCYLAALEFDRIAAGAGPLSDQVAAIGRWLERGSVAADLLPARSWDHLLKAQSFGDPDGPTPDPLLVPPHDGAPPVTWTTTPSGETVGVGASVGAEHGRHPAHGGR